MVANDTGSPRPRGRHLLVGVDIGGTFTDCVVLDRRGRITATKCPSTPENFAEGMLAAMSLAAERLGLSLEEFCRSVAVLTHGTTVGTNALLQRKGARVGLITTRGHEDAIHIMRGSRGVTARDIRKVVHFPESSKPEPIVPKRLIEGVSERVDCFGEVVVQLNESEAEQAIRRLIDQGVEAIGVCFLWSFKHSRHELRVKEMIRELAPSVFVSCSVDLAPKWGEYERITATALNAYIGPVMAAYLGNLDRRLKTSGYVQPLQITQCAGGSISVDKAMDSPLLTLDSGPVSGVTGTQYLGRLMACPNIITTDMGGTSFDVGIISGSQPAYSFVSNVAQYEYFLPRVDIHAIGSGGGSLARVDDSSRTLQVGPESAGADPGPACYGKGGTTATVTDADVVLGMINADNFLGGRIKLDREKAAAAVQEVADALKLPLMEAASGIAHIAEFKMSDIIRKMTVEKGFDPRDFVLFAFGGAGPVHAGVFAYELGVQKVIVPQKAIASSWCAFGAASADILHVYEQVDIQASPFDVPRVNRWLETLEKKAHTQMERDGIAPGRRRFHFSLDMRHRGQINEVEVPLPERRLKNTFETALRRRFSARYEQLYGRGSSYGEARQEIVTLRLRASAVTTRPRLAKAKRTRSRIDPQASLGKRTVYWSDLRRAVPTSIYDGALLVSGNRLAGPAVVETTDTTVVVHPGRALNVDALAISKSHFARELEANDPYEASMPKVSTAKNVAFDGRKTGYVPPRKLSISPRLKLHRKHARRIDPITYEVVRHALWHVNEEHGATIQRLSGSPVAMYALDLNPSILTEDGEFVYFGPYMQYMSGVTDAQVKWVLEYRSENPEIRDGDMFLANDPWVGAAHQQDVMLICPVFWKGELFCWVTNCLHQYDLGGITPSSFCGSAENAFQEGICIPPVKIVERNAIRRDIEELYLRSSRKPEAVALDFRAQLAGNITARDRVHALIQRYGPEVVKGVMKRIIDNAEAAFLKKLKRLPDGVWRERSYVECCRPGDRRTHRVMLTLRKKGTSLVFENEGTAPQDGAMNATYSGWRGSIMVAVNELLCWDQYFCIGGALRHIDFDPTPGTFNCADFPASVSTAPIQAMEISLYPAYNVLSKMIHSDAELRKDIMCIGGTSQWPATIFRGIDQWGERYGYILVDPIGGAIGAFATGDGISTGGQSRTPICKLPNVEHTEQTFPLLFLYRKEVVDSGGAGRYRGGLSAESCFIPHRAEAITHDTLSSGNAIPTSLGLMGGYPAATNAYKFKRSSDVLEGFAELHIPDDIAEVKGEDVTLGLRQENFRQEPRDVYAVVWSAGGGFGDPHERDPEKVRADAVEDRCVSLAAAREIYGVVITSKGSVDAAATDKLRSARRDANRKKDGSVVRLGGTMVSRLTDSLDLRREKHGVHIGCSRCAADLGPTRGNYKDRCTRRDSAITEANPNIGDYRRYIDDRPVFRQFFCPGCGALIENEVARESDPVLHDIELHIRP